MNNHLIALHPEVIPAEKRSSRKPMPVDGDIVGRVNERMIRDWAVNISLANMQPDLLIDQVRGTLLSYCKGLAGQTALRETTRQVIDDRHNREGEE